MAAEVPNEKADDMPGTFPPETPNELPGKHPEVPSPLPSAQLFFGPGDITDFSTYTNDQPRAGEKTFSVNPIPASAGAGNPITLKPGEPVPANVDPIDHAAKTDQAAYEKSDAYPGSSSAAADASPFIQSAGAGTTTAALAGQVPMEPRAQQEVAKASGEDADEKAKTAALATGGAAAGIVGGVAAGAAAIAAGVPSSITSALTSLTGTGAGAPAEEPKEAAAAVPEPVKDAQTLAHASPEASGVPEAVAEKSAMEKELLNKVPTTNEAGEPGPSAATAATTATAPGDVFASDPVIADSATAPAIAAVTTGAAPAAFKDDPVAAGQSGADSSSPLNASASTPAKTAATQAAATEAAVKAPATPAAPAAAVASKADSRDVSPHTKPEVTSGIETTAAGSQATGTPASAATGSATSTPTKENASDKKNKRRSFFGKIKDKLKS